MSRSEVSQIVVFVTTDVRFAQTIQYNVDADGESDFALCRRRDLQFHLPE